jgi:hypothetical protein
VLSLSDCASAPEQFAGIVSPEVAPRYEIVLRHRRLGEARFQFSCTRPIKIAVGIELFRRRCTVSGTVTPLPGTLAEQAARRLIFKGRLRKRVADYFRRSNRFFVKVSWPIGAPPRRARSQSTRSRPQSCSAYSATTPRDAHRSRSQAT